MAFNVRKKGDFYLVVKDGRVISRHMNLQNALNQASAGFRVKIKRRLRKQGAI